MFFIIYLQLWLYTQNTWMNTVFNSEKRPRLHKYSPTYYYQLFIFHPGDMVSWAVGLEFWEMSQVAQIFTNLLLSVVHISPRRYDLMGLLPNTQNCGLRVRRDCRERFLRHRLQRKPLVSDPGMHHGTCVTHVLWCMSGSLTRDDVENVTGILGACTTRNFAYLVRGLWAGPKYMVYQDS